MSKGILESLFKKCFGYIWKRKDEYLDIFMSAEIL